MGRVLTNNIGLSYAVEASVGLLPGESAPGVGANTAPWSVLEPNDITGFGATITTVARSPISNLRQRRKGTVTDLDSAADFEADFTVSSLRDFIEGFVFATGINTDVTNLTATSTNATGDNYEGLTALNAAQAEKIEVDTLLWVSGATNAANNGLKTVDVDASDTDTIISVGETLVAESGSTINISFAGHRIAAADAPTWTWDAGASQATLTLTGIGTLLAQLGLTPGQFVHIGSKATLTSAITNGFENASANDMVGYARARVIGTDTVVFDKVDAALQFTDAVAPANAVDVLFGEFFRNVAVDASDYLERSYQFEAEFPGLGDGTSPSDTTTSFQYSRGNFANTLAVNLPLTDKATLSYGFIGTDTDNPTTTRKALASAASQPLLTGALNTSSDIARLRITEVDEDGLTTDFKNLTLNITNNVSPQKCLGILGAAFVSFGNFELDLEAQLLFTSPRVIEAIRGNETLTMEFIVGNDDGVVAVDIPSMTLGGGDREYPLNESVLINTTAQAFVDPTFNTSIGVSVFPVPIS